MLDRGACTGSIKGYRDSTRQREGAKAESPAVPGKRTQDTSSTMHERVSMRIVHAAIRC